MFADSMHGYAVGVSGVILKTENAGGATSDVHPVLRTEPLAVVKQGNGYVIKYKTPASRSNSLTSWATM